MVENDRKIQSSFVKIFLWKTENPVKNIKAMNAT